MNPQINAAHSAFERAVADIKSMNLTPEGKAILNEWCETLDGPLSNLATEVKLLSLILRPHHIPDEAAPNPINRKE